MDLGSIIFLLTVCIPVIVIAGFAIGIYFGFRRPRKIENKDPSDFGHPFKIIQIAAPDRNLFGWFIPAKQADAKRAPTFVVVHGWGANAEISLEMMEPFLGQGSNLLLFDVRNHGKSGGAFLSTLKSFAQDTNFAVDWLKANIYEEADSQLHPDISLVGHSMGGAAVLYTASKRRDIASVVAVSTFAHLDWLLAIMLRSFYVRKAHVPFVIDIIEKVSGMSLDEYAPENTINNIECPVLIMHGTDDEVLPFTQFERIREVCTNPRALFLAVEGARHYPVEPVHHYRFEMGEFLNDTRPKTEPEPVFKKLEPVLE